LQAAGSGSHFRRFVVAAAPGIAAHGRQTRLRTAATADAAAVVTRTRNTKWHADAQYKIARGRAHPRGRAKHIIKQKPLQFINSL